MTKRQVRVNDLFDACRGGALDDVKRLVAGRNVNTEFCKNAATRNYQLSCLDIAADAGRLDICEYLVKDCDANADLINLRGKKPWYYPFIQLANKKELDYKTDVHFSICKLLLERGDKIDLNYQFKIKSENGTCNYTVLEALCRCGHFQVFRYLIENCTKVCIEIDPRVFIQLIHKDVTNRSRLIFMEYIIRKIFKEKYAESALKFAKTGRGWAYGDGSILAYAEEKKTLSFGIIIDAIQCRLKRWVLTLLYHFVLKDRLGPGNRSSIHKNIASFLYNADFVEWPRRRAICSIL